MVRVNILPSSKEISDKIQKEAKEVYGFNLDQRSVENLEWMRKNGYDVKKRFKRGTREKRSKHER